MMAAKGVPRQFEQAEDFKLEVLSRISTDGIKTELVPEIKKELKDRTWHFIDEEGDCQGCEDEIEIKEELPDALNNLVENMKSEEDTEFTLHDRAQAILYLKKSSIANCKLTSRIKEKGKEKELTNVKQNKEIRELWCQESEKKYRCAVCLKSFRRKHYMKLHIQLHNGEGYNCGTCGRTFSYKNKLQRHIAVHQNERYNCSVCGNSYSREESMKIHLRTIHEGKGHSCSICGKLFSVLIGLKNHLHAHLRKRKCFIKRKYDVGKQFKCSTCGRSYAQKASLKFHLQNHDGIKHKCSLCSKSYTDRSSLRRHKVNHDGKHYSCLICGKSFSAKKHLRKHIRKNQEMRRSCVVSLSTNSVSQNHLLIQKDNFCSGLNGKRKPPAGEKRERPEENGATEMGLPKSKGKLSTKPIPFRNLQMTQKKGIM